jgi:hypothetical protein
MPEIPDYRANAAALQQDCSLAAGLIKTTFFSLLSGT